MRIVSWWITFCWLALLATSATAADYRLESLNEPPPEQEVARSVVDQLAPTAYRVIRGNSRTLCDIWICQRWETKPDFQASASVLYPFQTGHLFGLIRFHRDGEDFRGQEIPAGVYTLRYAQQPVDGNHVGTSDTLDFLLISPVEEDDSPEAMDEDTLLAVSAATAGTTHPAMFSFLRQPDDDLPPPSMHHDEQRDYWSVRIAGRHGEKERPEPLVVEFVVVGVSEL